MIRWITIPAGTFRMGAVEDDRFALGVERPAQLLHVDRAFAMSATVVTAAQWSSLRLKDPRPGGDLPVTRVSWHEARAFAAELGADLPTEAQWEYACRAGTTSVFPTGEALLPHAANYLLDEHRAPVGPGRMLAAGSLPPNPWGLFEMLGNALEWVRDDWERDLSTHAARASALAPAPAPAADREPNPARTGTVRGGAWDQLPRLLRPSARDPLDRGSRLDHLGFRMVRPTPA